MYTGIACYPLSRGRRAMPLPVLASPARRYQSSIRSLTRDSFAHTRLNPSTVLVGSARQIGLLRMPDSASNAHEDKRVLGRPFLTLASCHHGAVPKHHHEGGAYGLSALGCYPSLAAWPGKGDPERLRAAEMAAQQALILPRLSDKRRPPPPPPSKRGGAWKPKQTGSP